MDAACRIYLLLLSLYHVATGLVSVFSPRLALRAYKVAYGFDPVERTQLSLVLKPWGALALFAGVAGLFAAADPVRYAGVVLGLSLLLAVRLVLRLLFAREAATVLGIPPRHNLANAALIAVGVVILLSWVGHRWL